MTALLQIIDDIPEFSRLIALEIKRNLEPEEDELSQNEAHKTYGRRWIEKWVERGQLHPQYHGAKKMYSRSEIERVKAKENITAKLIIRKK